MAKHSRNSRSRTKRVEHRTNHNIRYPEIRLVGDNMDDVSKVAGRKVESGIFDTRQAISWAEQLDKDLVEISPNADPPVCKIIDYNKFVFEKKKREKEMKARSAKTVVKEIRFGPNTDDHDFEFKLRHAIKFLEEGAKVKAYVHFRGRTIVFKERGQLLLLRLLKELQDYGSADDLPKMEGRRMIVMISPKKSAKN